MAVEKLAQFNHPLMMLLGIHEEYAMHCLRMKKEHLMIGFIILTTKTKFVLSRERHLVGWTVHVKSNNHQGSSRSSGSQTSIHSNRSSEGKGSRRSKSSKNKEIEDRAKIAELLAEAQDVKQRQQIENQAEMMKIKQGILKTKAWVAYSWKETTCELATDRKILGWKREAVSVRKTDRPIKHRIRQQP